MQIFPKEIDWLNATKEDRKVLYRVCGVIAHRQGDGVGGLLDQVFGGRQHYGTDYMANFRQGKIARSKAHLIYVWICENHFKTAHSTAPYYFPMAHTDALGAFLKDRAIRGKLRIVQGTSWRGLVQRASEVSAVNICLRLGEEFCFALESSTSGVAVAFQGYKGKWHPIALGAGGKTLEANIFEEFHLLPMDKNYLPVALVEVEDAGVHDFVIAVFPDEYVGSLELDQILQIRECQIFCV